MDKTLAIELTKQEAEMLMNAAVRFPIALADPRQRILVAAVNKLLEKIKTATPNPATKPEGESP